jgi:hypothetical protein
MACRLVALDKQPGTRPVGIGEVYRRLMAKCVLSCVGSWATHACGNLNLCAGLKSGVEGAVHAVRTKWEKNQPIDNKSTATPNQHAPRTDTAEETTTTTDDVEAEGDTRDARQCSGLCDTAGLLAHALLSTATATLLF